MSKTFFNEKNKAEFEKRKKESFMGAEWNSWLMQGKFEDGRCKPIKIILTNEYRFPFDPAVPDDLIITDLPQDILDFFENLDSDKYIFRLAFTEDSEDKFEGNEDDEWSLSWDYIYGMTIEEKSKEILEYEKEFKEALENFCKEQIEKALKEQEE